MHNSDNKFFEFICDYYSYLISLTTNDYDNINIKKFCFPEFLNYSQNENEDISDFINYKTDKFSKFFILILEFLHIKQNKIKFSINFQNFENFIKSYNKEYLSENYFLINEIIEDKENINKIIKEKLKDYEEIQLKTFCYSIHNNLLFYKSEIKKIIFQLNYKTEKNENEKILSEKIIEDFLIKMYKEEEFIIIKIEMEKYKNLETTKKKMNLIRELIKKNK